MAMAAEAAPAAMAAKGPADLFEFIDHAKSNCLNQKDEHPWSCMVKAADSDEYCESNVDEQLLVNIEFREKVKIQKIIFKAAAEKEDHAPSDIKVYVNQEAMGFGDVDSVKPAQVFELESEDVESGKELATQYQRFQNVNNISIFVERNHGDTDTSILSRIVLIGCPIAGTNMSELKKVG